MKVWLYIWFWLFQSLGASAAPTIYVHAQTTRDILPQSSFESIIWHELHSSLGHEAHFVDTVDLALLDQMRRTKITTVLEMNVNWKVDIIELHNERLAGGHFPIVTVREWAIKDNQLVALKKWETSGVVALFKVKDGPKNELISIPEVSLQSAVELALRPIEAPHWTQEDTWIRVPVEVMADDEYRSFYGEKWQDIIRLRIDRANALLRPTGILLDIEKMTPWTSQSNNSNLSDLLEQFSKIPRQEKNRIRIGFTQQTTLAITLHRDVEDVGRAYLPGRDVLIADQAVVPGHPQKWDVAEEGIAIAHEVLHALGVPHNERQNQLMSATKTGTVHRVSTSSTSLARAAAHARYSDWDPNATLDSLSHAAHVHLSDPSLQVDYVSENFSQGTGQKNLDRLEPTRLSALSNLAVGQYFLAEAIKNPRSSKTLVKRALAHTESALAQNPGWVSASELRQAIIRITPQKPTFSTPDSAIHTDGPSICAPNTPLGTVARPICD